MQEQNLDIKIGNKLRELRDQHRLTTREVGERLGISHGYVSKIENGKIPSLTILNKLCELYRIDIAELFDSKKIEVPEELDDLGVEWLLFSKEMKKQKLTPEQIKKYIQVVKSFKDL